jgi:transposase
MEERTQQSQPTESAMGFIQKIKRRTKRKYTAEEKIRVVLEGMKREVSIADLCRREGIHPHIYYNWVKNFMEAGKARLRGDFKRDATEEDVTGLKRENDRLKMLLAEQLLESELVKKSLLGTELGE